MRNRVPDVPGAGRGLRQPDEHRYLETRPNARKRHTAIVESIRAGLVFQLKQAVALT